MRLLPRRRREAMYAIYAFCREVDDIADEGGSPAEKQQALAAWRDEIERLYAGRPRRPTTQALLPAVTDYKLPKEEFLEIGRAHVELQSLMRISYAVFCLKKKRI